MTSRNNEGRVAYFINNETRTRLAMETSMATVLKGKSCMAIFSSYPGYLMSGGSPMMGSPPARRMKEPTM